MMHKIGGFLSKSTRNRIRKVYFYCDRQTFIVSQKKVKQLRRSVQHSLNVAKVVKYRFSDETSFILSKETARQAENPSLPLFTSVLPAYRCSYLGIKVKRTQHHESNLTHIFVLILLQYRTQCPRSTTLCYLQCALMSWLRFKAFTWLRDHT